MDRFSILTLGCKVNQYESQQIRELLERLGLAPADVTHLPDLVVINTCCVTHTASAKSRHLLRHALRHGPKAIVVCGCLPVAPCDELQPAEENVHVVKDRSRPFEPPQMQRPSGHPPGTRPLDQKTAPKSSAKTTYVRLRNCCPFPAFAARPGPSSRSRTAATGSAPTALYPPRGRKFAAIRPITCWPRPRPS